MPGGPINYDRLSIEYGRHRRINPGVLTALLEQVGGRDAPIVLEVGCGTGNYLEAVETITGVEVHGIDPSSEMLERLRERLPEAKVQRATAEELPFENSSFDLIYSVDVIHHVLNRPAYFREALRVLKQGGTLCTVTDSAEDIHNRVPLSSHFPETIEHELRRYPSIDLLRDEMADAGFMSIAASQTRHEYDLLDATPWRDKAFSSLHLITPEQHSSGVARMQADLAKGPIHGVSLYTLLWGNAGLA
jgi:ubiquinone/menaquinone biosynthesis C-methylase UbiE